MIGLHYGELSQVKQALLAKDKSMMSLEAFLIKMVIAYTQNHHSAPAESQLQGWTELYNHYLSTSVR